MRLLLVTCFLSAFFQNTWAQTDSTTTAAPTSNTTVGNANTTANVNVSGSTPPNSSVTPMNGSSSTSTANPNSNVTQSPAAPNITSNETTAAPPNTTDSNSTTTLPTTTTTTVTTTAKPAAPFSSDTAVYILKLSVGPNSTADIVYTNPNLTRDHLLANINPYFQQSGVVDLTNSDGFGNYDLLLKFFFGQIYGVNSTLEEKIKNATIELNNTETELTVSGRTLEKISQFFQNASGNPCLAENICQVGYVCQDQGCALSSSCGPDTCNGNGQCVVSFPYSKDTPSKCICDESYDTEYYGDQCENSRTGKLQIIAIIAGVLGAAILVLLVVILIICITQRRKGSGYEINSKGHKNKAYDGELTS